METLKLYHVADKYIAYLRTRDSRVPYNKNLRRPYVGVVLYVGAYKYFVPMESPKPNHKNMKSGVHIMRLDGGNLGILGFNNMIPVHDAALVPFDIDTEVQDVVYADLLRRQVSYINRNKSDVLDRASKTYYRTVSGRNKFLASICCDFKKLERSCDRFDPSR